MHAPVGANGYRMSQYTEHVGKYDSSSLLFPVPLSSVGSFATTNNMSINVYGVDDDKEVIYPLGVSSTLVPDKYVELLLFERNGIQHDTTIRNFSWLVGSQMSIHSHGVYCCKQSLHAYKTQELLDVHATDCCRAQRTKFLDDPRCRFIIQKQYIASPEPMLLTATELLSFNNATTFHMHKTACR